VALAGYGADGPATPIEEQLMASNLLFSYRTKKANGRSGHALRKTHRRPTTAEQRGDVPIAASVGEPHYAPRLPANKSGKIAASHE
jgi:hypothetical protein